MTKRKTLQHLLVALIMLVPLLYTQLVWNELPEMIPTHFNSNGQPDDYTAKSSFWIIIALLAGPSLLCYGVIQCIDKIDPKRANKPVPSSFNELSIIIVSFISLVGILIVRSALHPEQGLIPLVLLPLVGILFVALGWYLPRLKPNYFVGIKLPWTLSSDYNWKKTHVLGGKVWLIGGMVLAVLPFVTKDAVQSIVLLFTIGIMVVVPIVYSFMVFRREKDSDHYFDEEAGR